MKVSLELTKSRETKEQRINSRVFTDSADTPLFLAIFQLPEGGAKVTLGYQQGLLV